MNNTNAENFINNVFGDNCFQTTFSDKLNQNIIKTIANRNPIFDKIDKYFDIEENENVLIDLVDYYKASAIVKKWIEEYEPLGCPSQEQGEIANQSEIECELIITMIDSLELSQYENNNKVMSYFNKKASKFFDYCEELFWENYEEFDV